MAFSQCQHINMMMCQKAALAMNVRMTCSQKCAPVKKIGVAMLEFCGVFAWHNGECSSEALHHFTALVSHLQITALPCSGASCAET